MRADAPAFVPGGFPSPTLPPVVLSLPPPPVPPPRHANGSIMLFNNTVEEPCVSDENLPLSWKVAPPQLPASFYSARNIEPPVILGNDSSGIQVNFPARRSLGGVFSGGGYHDYSVGAASSSQTMPPPPVPPLEYQIA